MVMVDYSRTDWAALLFFCNSELKKLPGWPDIKPTILDISSQSGVYDHLCNFHDVLILRQML